MIKATLTDFQRLFCLLSGNFCVQFFGTFWTSHATFSWNICDYSTIFELWVWISVPNSTSKQCETLGIISSDNSDWVSIFTYTEVRCNEIYWIFFNLIFQNDRKTFQNDWQTTRHLFLTRKFKLLLNFRFNYKKNEILAFYNCYVHILTRTAWWRLLHAAIV